MTVLLYHDIFLKHDTGQNHPESPKRLEAVLSVRTKLSNLAAAQVREAPMINEERLSHIHEPKYITQLKAFCLSGGGYIDMDTVASLDSWEAAKRAAGAAATAVKIAVEESQPVFCLVRPPGHHALPDRAMGFCLLNNAAIAVDAAKTLGVDRVAVFDWDAHHGNGDQAFFESDPNVLYLSLHQSPLYPGTGWLMETGIGSGVGSVINMPLPPGAGDRAVELMLSEVVEPVLSQFRPQLLIIEAGYDSHHRDPLANLQFSCSAYSSMTNRLTKFSKMPPIMLLEGGYDLEALPYCIDATLAGLTTADYREPEQLGSPKEVTSEEIELTLQMVKKAIARDRVFHLDSAEDADRLH